MPDGWEWDETLFAGTAVHYGRGRLPYAPGLADTLAEELGLEGTGRLLDVGCGPGTLALLLADRFREVVGVDPDPGMLAEAQRGADRRGLAGRARWVRARAEQLPDGLGEFTAATFGNSFHWMDRDLVATTVRGLLRPGGAFVHVADLKTEDRDTEGLPHPAVPRQAIEELVRRHLGPVRRAGRGVLRNGTPSGEDEVLARAGFRQRRRLVVPGGQPLERPVDEVVDEVFSLSYAAPHLFGSGRDAFEADLRALLQAASPGGVFSERLPSTEVRLWFS